MKLFTFIIFSLSLFSLNGQVLTRSVIGSAGTTTSKGSITMQSTLGQPSTIGTKTNSNGFGIRQGFHQTYSISKFETEDFTITVYPNPTSGVFYFETDLPETVDFSFFIEDSFGRRIQNGIGKGSTEIKADITLAENGIYFLQIETPQSNGTFKISKTL